MSNLAQLEKALRNADAAGDTDAAKQIAGAIREAQSTPGPSWGSALASAAIRPIVKGVSALPLMAMDAGVGARNLLTGENYELPSSMFNKALDENTVVPKDLIGKGAEFISSALVGSLLPAPRAAKQAPAGFVKPSEDLVRQMTLKNSQQAGYVVPPATTNPTIVNKALESLGGKVGTAQDAAVKNQSVTASLAKRALGISDEAPITGEALQALRTQASAPNQAIRQTGTITTDADFATDIAGVLSKYKSAGGVSKELAKTEVSDLANSFEKSFPASDAVDAIQVMRDRATAAYAKGDAQVGQAYRSLSKALEDQVERHLGALGKDGEGLLKAFREGRQLIAITFSVEKAFNPATGTVSASKLAAQLSKGKPLSGELKTIAQFGQSFPKAAREVLDSGSVRNTDVIMGAGTAALSKEPTWLLYPFLRQAVRAGLLSNTGQRLATPGAFGVPSGLVMGGMTAEELARQGLFGQ